MYFRSFKSIFVPEYVYVVITAQLLLGSCSMCENTPPPYHVFI